MAGAAVAVASCHPPSGQEEAVWARATSDVVAAEGRAIVSGNWGGAFRPWVLRGSRVEPFLPSTIALPPGLDLYRPLWIGRGRFLLSGALSGRSEFDLYHFDERSGRFRNLTASPDVDDGDACASPDGSLVSFRSGRKQGFFRLDAGPRLVSIDAPGAPPLRRCAFAADGSVVGLSGARNDRTMVVCSIGSAAVRCRKTPALEEFEVVSGLEARAPGRVTLVARRRGTEWRRVWKVSAPFERLEALPVPEGLRADVLEHDGTVYRFGRASRYRLSSAPGVPGIVSAFARSGDRSFAIVATRTSPRTVAELGRDRWEAHLPAGRRPASDAPEIEEVHLGPEGRSCSGWHFGERRAPRVVVWWHGGPAENVSPRYHPYFHALDRMGFSVLAVNYPGSTGFGAAFEAQFADRPLRGCADAAWTYLQELGPRQIVSWSVSAGRRLQGVILDLGLPVSAIVDQVGVGEPEAASRARSREIPWFAIRGIFDPTVPPGDADFLYAGGHDLARETQFQELMARFSDFMATLPDGESKRSIPPASKAEPDP